MALNKVYASEPYIGGWYSEEEKKVLIQALEDSNDYNVGFNGKRSRSRFEQGFKVFAGTKHAICVNSGGVALDLVLNYLNLSPKDEVISCAINFPGTHLAIINTGAKLILCEPDPKTLNIDPNDIVKKLSKHTKAIVVTHMNGLCADIDLIQKKLDETGNSQIKIIVDAARACGAKDSSMIVGKKGWATIFSFHAKKIITTLGEGGMITTDDDSLAEKVQEYRAFGLGKGWGSSYKMSKIQAEIGLIQLKKIHTFIELRIKLAQERISILEKNKDLYIVSDYKDFKNIYYLFTVVLPKSMRNQRDNIRKRLLDEYRINTSVGNKPTYEKNDLIRSCTSDQKTPISDDIGSRIICLPIHPRMTKQDNEYISNSFLEIIESL